MKNIIKIIIPLTVFLILLIVSFFSFNKENNIYHGLYNSNKTYFKTDTAVAIMYETDNGNYEVSDGTSWLLDGYRFNESLSGCENGGTISWNDATQKVEMKTNISDKCYVYFDKYSSVQITNVVASNITSNSITVNVSATSGTNQISKYYYSINNGGSYAESTNNIYTFTGLEKGTKYNIKVYAVDTKNYSSNIYSLSATTDDALLLADYIIDNVYVSDGVNGLYYHDGVGTYTNADQEAGDNSYRYSGANPNNYVCFGSSSTTCPSNNLYRIIGVFDEDNDGEYNIKLIKNTTIGNYAWDTAGGNNWSSASLNKILNSTLNELGANWSSKIENTAWKVGGISYSNIFTNGYLYAKNLFQYEVGNNSLSSSVNEKIGLVYSNELYYSSLPTYWAVSQNATEDDFINIDENSWLSISYTGVGWTITKFIGYNGYAITWLGGFINPAETSAEYEIKPVFYLLPSVEYVSGTGTKSNPYRIS